MTDSGLRVKTRKEAHMKTQLSKPARSKARYTDQYKQEALELWRASGRSAAKVAAELGIRPPLRPLCLTAVAHILLASIYDP